MMDWVETGTDKNQELVLDVNITAYITLSRSYLVIFLILSCK